jgi:hypothetical protein
MSTVNIQAEPAKGNFYRFSLGLLTISSWISGIIFALYIFGFYILANTVVDVEAWNSVLPKLYSPEKPAAMTGMISHFFFGSLLLIIGPIQFSQTIRAQYPNFHRWTGFFYTLSSFITGFGGIVFLFVWGAAGGIPMLLGFMIYGLLMMIAPVQVIRYALKGNLVIHREWAIRLFALVLGSWIYRMGYGIIRSLMNDFGLAKNFSGPMDYFMDFSFFVIPLIVAEIVIKGKNSSTYSLWRFTGSALCILTSLLIWNATLYFLNGSWGDVIQSMIGK